ncbi:MAG: squalene synthase HpnC [Pseudonocardiales bacterium]|nr:squalene synthase HpnC [Pseudonocardiales bacterium]
MAAIPDPGVRTRDRELRRQRHAENFPVALRLLPRRLRADLIAVYEVVRVIDDLGDQAVGKRTALLGEFADDLATIWDGGPKNRCWPKHPVLARLAPVVAARGLDREPFARVIQANLVDQRVHRYASYAELRGYCTLSAEPIGRIVLAIFGVHNPVATELSDRVCTALQLIEHWQDVAEDRRAGRVYLPQEDLAAFGVAEAELDAPENGAVSSPALRQLMLFQITRAAELLESGAPLVGLLRGWARLAVAGYLAGGRAALDALRRAHGEVLTGPPRPRRRDVLRHLGWVFFKGGQPPGWPPLKNTQPARGGE